MKALSLELENFLSYKALHKVEFYEGLNVVVGKNTAGKTNMLDAIYMSAIGKTSRYNRDKDLINNDSGDGARTKLLVEKKYGKISVEIKLSPQGQKYILLSKSPITRIGELMGGATAVFFSPDEIKLIKESPADRRRFLDISLSQQSRTYFYTLTKYNKLLQQRNKLLKDYSHHADLNDMLKLVEQQLLPCAELIFKQRNGFLERLNLLANEKHLQLTDGKEKLFLAYESEKVTTDSFAEDMQRLYDESREKDKRLEYTSVGIHRDDIKILVNDIDVRKYGSRGQQRTAVLSMKLAECDFWDEKSGERPLLLLDDVLSELDESRQKALINATLGTQTLITCTEFDDSLVSVSYKKITVKNGKIYSEMRNSK